MPARKTVFKKPPPPPNLNARIRGAVSGSTPSRPAPPPSKPAGAPRSERAPVFRQATVLFADGFRLGVVAKNISETGARVDFFQRLTLPDEVVLLESTLKLHKRARVVWQRDGAAGLKFLD